MTISTQYLPAYLGTVLDKAKAAINVDYAFIAVGAEVAWDSPCGQVWVRLVALEPIQAEQQPGGRVLQWNATIEVGHLRCVATLDDNGNPPSPTQITADAQQVLDDVEALRDMIECEVDHHRMIRWDPSGPNGAMSGGAWLYTVRVDGCKCEE